MLLSYLCYYVIMLISYLCYYVIMLISYLCYYVIMLISYLCYYVIMLISYLCYYVIKLFMLLTDNLILFLIDILSMRINTKQVISKCWPFNGEVITWLMNISSAQSFNRLKDNQMNFELISFERLPTIAYLVLLL